MPLRHHKRRKEKNQRIPHSNEEVNFDFQPEYKVYSSDESVEELLAPAKKHEKHTEKYTKVPQAKPEIKESRYKRPDKNLEEPKLQSKPTLIEESV